MWAAAAAMRRTTFDAAYITYYVHFQYGWRGREIFPRLRNTIGPRYFPIYRIFEACWYLLPSIPPITSGRFRERRRLLRVCICPYTHTSFSRYFPTISSPIHTTMETTTLRKETLSHCQNIPGPPFSRLT